jgi:hypothetical protein
LPADEVEVEVEGKDTRGRCVDVAVVDTTEGLPTTVCKLGVGGVLRAGPAEVPTGTFFTFTSGETDEEETLGGLDATSFPCDDVFGFSCDTMAFI